MAINSVYLPPPAATVASYLAAQPPRPASDHNIVSHVYTTTNSAPTQGGVPVTIPLALPVVTADAVNSVLSNSDIDISDDSSVLDIVPGGVTPRSVIRLQIQNITMPIVTNSALRIFFNRPDAHDGLLETDLHHVAKVTFFCCGPMSGVNPCFVFDVTKTMKRLKVKKLIKEGWNLQVLAVPITEGAVVPTVIPGTITMTVANL
ncbi:MAG TPA: hypothetical protein VGD78_07860 [Chthoniobacterales bacterium]